MTSENERLWSLIRYFIELSTRLNIDERAKRKKKRIYIHKYYLYINNTAGFILQSQHSLDIYNIINATI